VIVVTCSCGWRLETAVARRIVTALACPRCRMPLVNAEIEE
jgi:hypothetical protein